MDSVASGSPATLQSQHATVVMIQTSRATNDGVQLSRADRQLRSDALMHLRRGIEEPTKQGSDAPTYRHRHAPTQPRTKRRTARFNAP